jgi:hypothetical protein
VQVRNNIFYTGGGVKMVNITASVAAAAVNFRFNGNAYYSGGSAFKILWGNSAYSSLSSWSSGTGQEKLNGVATGYQGDPRFVAPGSGHTIGNADKLSSLTAYKLQSSSPLINLGVTPPGVLAASMTDFWGDTVPKGGKYDIGADEVI